MTVNEKAAYMLSGLERLLQGFYKEHLRPINYLEIETWFKYLKHRRLNCYLKFIRWKLNPNSEKTDDNVDVAYGTFYDKCVIYFADNDIEYGTLYVQTEDKIYAFPSIHFEWPSNIYVDDNDEEITEIKEYIKNILKL